MPRARSTSPQSSTRSKPPSDAPAIADIEKAISAYAMDVCRLATSRSTIEPTFYPVIRSLLVDILKAQRLTHRHAHRRLAGWLKKAGISRAASPHALRHTFATLLYAKTGDLLLVQKALRHRCIALTMVYAHLDDGRVRAALEG